MWIIAFFTVKLGITSQSVENLSKLHLSHFFSAWSPHNTFSHVHPLFYFPQILSQPTLR